MPHTALIVDDEQSIQNMLAVLIGKAGDFVVDSASSIGEAEQFLGERRYDLVIADIYLGNGTGIDLLRRIREHDRKAQVILITGYPEAGSAAEALRLGASDYLTKPFTPQQIIAVVQRAMRTKHLVEENERQQANLNAIFHSASDGIVLVDRENRLAQVNEAAMRSCRYLPEHLGACLSAIESGCAGACRKIFADVLHDGVQRTFHRLECRKPDGTKRIISLSVSPVIDNEGATDGAVAIVRDETDLVFLEKQVRRKNGYGGIIGANGAMQRMYTLVEMLADVQTTVLINGESGTGKELVAAALHHQGARRDKPFVKVNCSALSEHLLESELFGHVRGAFTGAVASKIGRFQKADKGTIFLDEIGDISMSMQMRLLRVLQEQEFEQVGDSTPIKVDVRIIAATNQDLAEKVRLGTFRHDLYYRLNVVRLMVPPLRDRRDDIPLLVEYFLEKFRQKFTKSLDAVSHEVMALFMCHPWPGNVRELEHIVEHAAILCQSPVIAVEDLPQDFCDAVPHQRLEVTPAASSRHDLSLEDALVMAEGNKARAARMLGVSRSTLYRMLQGDPDPVAPP